MESRPSAGNPAGHRTNVTSSAPADVCLDGADQAPDFIRLTREGYDAVAREYAVHYLEELDHKPLDRALLDCLVVDVGSLGPICDLGCGPGEVARYLRSRGADVVGIDLSPTMVAEARRLTPEIPFAVGNLLALDVPDESYGGIAAFYSLIHVPRDRVVDALVECRRVLRPGGLLLLGCHLGAEVVHLDEWWGRSVTLDFAFYTARDLGGRVQSAGLQLVQSLTRPPYPEVEYQSERLYVLARRPAEPRVLP